MLNCDYLFLSRDYLFTLIKMSKYFILSCYYHICLPQPIWNSSARRKCALGRWGIVCAQAGSNWVAVGPVSNPLFRILGSNTTGGSLAHFNQKRPTTMCTLNLIVWCYVWHYVMINKVVLLLFKIMVTWIFEHYHRVHEMHSM